MSLDVQDRHLVGGLGEQLRDRHLRRVERVLVPAVLRWSPVRRRRAAGAGHAGGGLQQQSPQVAERRP